MKFFRFFNESSEAMAIADLKGVILVSNASFKRLISSLDGKVHLPDGEENGNGDFSSSLDFLSIHDAVRFSSYLSKLSSGEEKSLDFRAPFHDTAGNVRWFKLNGWLMEENPETEAAWRGPFIGITIDDETREQEAEDRLLEDKKIAEKAIEAKSRFLAAMSHEIRTPIQTIIGMAELLQETRLDHEQAEYVRQERLSAEVLLALVNDILDYSKLEAGKMELETLEFDPAETVEQAVQMISIEAHKKGLEIAAAIPREARCIIRGDPNRFRQVVINMVKNAVKFTASGSVIIRASVTRGDAPSMTVSVEDTGIGIPEENRGQLFSPFMQANASYTRLFGGTGLGLAISRSIVELMHGTIRMHPNEAEGGGSVFAFTVPLDMAAESSPAQQEDGGDLWKWRADKQNARILIVDDTAASADIIASYLGDLSCRRVECAASGEAALAMMRQAAPDDPYELCFVDMNMPVMDGWRLAAEINGDKSINAAHLILMVPLGRLERDAKMILLQWFDGYIIKPVLLRDICGVLTAVFGDGKPETGNSGETVSFPVGMFQESHDGTDHATVPAQRGGLLSTGMIVAADTIPGAVSRNAYQMQGQSRLTALIVEDHEVNRKVFSLMMEKLGVNTVLAEDGLDCLEKAASGPVDIVFMDLQMPRMDGFEAAAELRKKGFDKPMIAVTASVMEDEVRRCRESGFDDLVLKPCKKPEIEAMLKKWGVRPTQDVPAECKAETEAPPLKYPGAGNPWPVFSGAELTQTFMGDRKIAASLLKKFIETSAARIDALPGLEQAENWEEARRLAHTIKGSALTLSGKELGETAAALERVYKKAMTGDLVQPHITEEQQTVSPTLVQAFDRFKQAVEAYLKEMP
jgi:signal transduction histidine kinase/CheY-like chemotaxis protein